MHGATCDPAASGAGPKQGRSGWVSCNTPVLVHHAEVFSARASAPPCRVAAVRMRRKGMYSCTPSGSCRLLQQIYWSDTLMAVSIELCRTPRSRERPVPPPCGLTSAPIPPRPYHPQRYRLRISRFKYDPVPGVDGALVTFSLRPPGQRLEVGA